jgi:hypothetical protein
LRSIDDLALEFLLELPQLRRGQLVVEDHEVNLSLGARSGEAPDLSAADKGGRVRTRPLLQHPQDDRGSRRVRKPGELVHRVFRLDAARGAAHHSNQRRAFHAHTTLSY